MVRQSEKSPVDRIRAFQRAVQANKRCADCVERGPTYVCLDFQTFCCQTCSGIHREFGHKIKGISLSEWTPVEVAAIEAGGNERAAQKWLGRLNRQEQPEPDNSDLEKLREFLKLKYIEKSWFVEVPVEAKPQEAVLEQPVAAPAAAPGEAAPLAMPREAAPAPLQASATPRPVEVGDLLSDCGSYPAVSVAPPPAPPACNASTGANALVAPSSDDCGAQWTADFSSVSDAILPGPAANAEGLIDLDFCCSVDNATCTAAPKPIPDACGTSSPKGPSSKPQDIEIVATKSPVAEPAEEPAPTAVSPSGAVKAASPREEPTLGDQFREAVLHGSTNDLMRLYRRASEPEARPTPPPVARERIEAFAAFDELGDWASPESAPRPPSPLSPPGGPLAPGPALPSVPPLPGAAQHSSPESLTPQRLAELMPQQCGMLTPQQVDKMSPQELVQMQYMIQSALQVRAQTTATQPGAQQAVPAAAPERPPSPPKQFGDLLAAFTEKNPIAGLSIKA